MTILIEIYKFFFRFLSGCNLFGIEYRSLFSVLFAELKFESCRDRDIAAISKTGPVILLLQRKPINCTSSQQQVIGMASKYYITCFQSFCLLYPSGQMQCLAIIYGLMIDHIDIPETEVILFDVDHVRIDIERPSRPSSHRRHRPLTHTRSVLAD